jgi:pyruvate kinase
MAVIRGVRGVARKPLILPKIETEQAAELQALTEIIRLDETAALIVARGDLGTECNRWMVPTLQRRVLRIAHSWLKPVIIATEVYGSMGRVPYPVQPNRGEILDLRHALEAAADGLMFTAETVVREDPETPVIYASRQANYDEHDIEDQDLYKAERDKRRERIEQWYKELLQRPERSLSYEDSFPLRKESDHSTMDWATSAVWRANNRRAAGIFSYTQNGNTARDLAHMLPYRPIFAITHSRQVLAKLALYRNVYPILVEGVHESFDIEDLKELVQEIMERFDIGHIGDEAFAMLAHPVGHEEKTDTLIQIRRCYRALM